MMMMANHVREKHQRLFFIFKRQEEKNIRRVPFFNSNAGRSLPKASPVQATLETGPLSEDAN